MSHLILPSSDVILAASGQDAGLADELRAALIAAALSCVDLLKQAQDPVSWADAVRRLAGLAGSFGAPDLHLVSASALASGVGDVQTIAQIEHAIARLAGKDLQIS